MTSYQPQAIWELCRQGYSNSADEAEIRWRAGETYQPDGQIRISRGLRSLIECCNYEVSAVRERRAIN